MNAALQKLNAIGRDAWLTLISHVNALMTIICAGVVMVNQTNPGVVQSLIAKLTPTQQALATLAFCSLVQFALARAKKAS